MHCMFPSYMEWAHLTLAQLPHCLSLKRLDLCVVASSDETCSRVAFSQARALCISLAPITSTHTITLHTAAWESSVRGRCTRTLLCC